MRAARKVYEKKGIDHTNFSDIAREAGVSRSTVFNYFAGSAELLTALCGKEIEDLEKAYQSADCRGKEGIIRIFDTFIEDTAQYPQLVTQIISSAVATGGPDNPLRSIEELLIKNLDGDADSRQDTAMLLMGAYYGLINHYHLCGLPFDSEKMKAQMRRMIVRIMD